LLEDDDLDLDLLEEDLLDDDLLEDDLLLLLGDLDDEAFLGLPEPSIAAFITSNVALAFTKYSAMNLSRFRWSGIDRRADF
jgi:hypothetical protein